MLKSATAKDELRVFNRTEIENVVTFNQDTVLKSANLTAYTFTVSGKIQFNDINDNPHPVRYAKVEVYDKNLILSDELLATTATDASGNYSVSITSSESNGPDIYVECLTEGLDNFPSGSNGIANVKDDILSVTYYSDTKGYVLDNSTTNSTISFTIANTGSDAGNYSVFDSFVEGWIKAKQYLNIEVDKIVVLWPEGNGASYDNEWWWLNLDRIAIGQNLRYDRDAHLHEYGHYINRIHQLVNGYGGKHGYENLTGTSAEVTRTRSQAVRTAMNEGWAHFFSVASQFSTTNDSRFDAFSESTNPMSRPFEDTPETIKGADHEGAVVGILWDIFDTGTNESHDNLSEGISEVWRILNDDGAPIDSIQQFATKWQTKKKGNLTSLLKIYSYFGIKSDLISIDQSLSSYQAKAGSTLMAYCSEKNLGSLLAGANVISIHLSADELFTPDKNGDRFIDEINIPIVLANSTSNSYSKSITIPSDVSPGNYYLFFSADGGKTIDETDEDNNFASVMLTISPNVFNHDYAVKSITVSNKNPTVGEDVLVSAVIMNEGTVAEADNQLVKLYDNGVLIDTYSSFSSLIAGGERTQNFNWTAKAGAHELKAEIMLSVDENSGNNTKTIKTYTGSSGNLLISGEENQEIEVTSYSGNTNSFSLQLQNTSGDDISSTISTTGAKESWISLIGGNSISIPSGQSKIYSISITVPTGTPLGTYSAGIEFIYAEGSKTSAINITIVVIESAKGLAAFEYWFDDIFESRKCNNINSQNLLELNASLSTSGLSNGLHSFHLRVLDKKGYWSAVASDFFHKLPLSLEGERLITTCEYWFDNDFAKKVATEITPGQTITTNEGFDVSTLLTGLHSYHVRYKDDAGRWSSVVSEFFHKLPLLPEGERKITACEYWFDDDFANKVSTEITHGQTITTNEGFDVSTLLVGLHSYHLRYKDDAGQWSSVVSEFFHKLPASAEGTRKITAYEYWFDVDYAEKVAVPVSPEQLVSLNNGLDAVSLQTGLHTYHVRYKDDAGQWSSVVSEFFHKLPLSSAQDNLITAYRYWFNRDEENMQLTNLPTPVNPFELIRNIDASALVTGENTIHFQFKDTRDAWSSVVTDTFTVNTPMVQEIIFTAGWNIFSSALSPSEKGIQTVVSPLIDKGSLVKVQNEIGNSFENLGIYGGWKNSIGEISASEGYKVKVNKNDTIEITGSQVDFPFAIPLESGWNIAGYPLLSDYGGMNLLQQLRDKGTLIKVQDESGNSIENLGIFGGWKNNIGNFLPGKGYKIKMSSKDTLWVYESYPKSSDFLPEIVATSHFIPAFSGNGVDHMNINLVGLPVSILQVGDELAIFDGAICVGAVTLMPHHLHSQTASIVTSAKDNQGVPGFSEGNTFVLKLWDTKNYQEYKLEPEIVKGTSTFIKNETTVASLEKYTTTGLEGLFASEQPEIKCYPNPFSQDVTIEIKLATDAQVQVEVLNQLGQRVRFLQTEKLLNSGIHRLTWNGRNDSNGIITPGVYHLRLNIDGAIIHKKIVYSK